FCSRARSNFQRMIRKPLFLAGFVLVVAAMLAGCSRSDSEGAATGQKYHCPMHPTYVSDRPGDCPICNMKLVPIKDDQPAPKSMAPASEEKTAHIAPGQYYCPMDTDVVRDAPGTCPECNMRLIQKQAAAPAAH